MKKVLNALVATTILTAVMFSINACAQSSTDCDEQNTTENPSDGNARCIYTDVGRIGVGPDMHHGGWDGGSDNDNDWDCDSDGGWDW